MTCCYVVGGIGMVNGQWWTPDGGLDCLEAQTTDFYTSLYSSRYERGNAYRFYACA